MIRSRTYYGPAGATGMVIPELANVTILHVEREGMGYEVISSIPGVGENSVWYVSSTGRLIFDTSRPFAGTSGGPVETDVGLEEIFVLWKE